MVILLLLLYWKMGADGCIVYVFSAESDVCDQDIPSRVGETCVSE
jgi:hypothetical protein